MGKGLGRRDFHPPLQEEGRGPKGRGVGLTHGFAAVAIVQITEETTHGAVTAFELHDEDRKHFASLKFDDRLSYACAKAHGAKLLFKGDNFVHRNVAQA